MKSMSFAMSLSRRGLPRELSSSTRTLWPPRTSAFTRPEPMKPEPPVTRILLNAPSPRAAVRTSAPSRCERCAASINCCTRKPAAKSGCAKVFVSMASKKRLASRDTGAMRPSGCAGVGRILDRDARQLCRRPLGMKQVETAHVVGALVVQHQRAVLAIELDAVAGAQIRRAAHRSGYPIVRRRIQAPSPPWSASSSSPGRPDSRALKPRDRTGKPFQIMKAMADEIA